MKKKTIMAVLIGMTVIMTQQRIIVLAATTSGDRQSSTVSATVPINIRLQSIKMRMLRLLMRTQKMKGREMHFR